MFTTEILNETIASINTFMEGAVPVVVTAIQDNIYAMKHPSKYSLTQKSIQCRKTYSPSPSYYNNHNPLIDTGALVNSFTKTKSTVKKGSIETEISTPLRALGHRMENGIGKTCHGSQILARPHMYLTDSATQQLDRLLDEVMQ